MISALFIWEAPPASREPSAFVSQPAIPIEGTAHGLAWGRCEVDERATAWRVPMTVDMPRVLPVTAMASPFATTLAVFERRAFFGGPLGPRGSVVFVLDGLDVERVAEVLPAMLERAEDYRATMGGLWR